MELNYSKIIHKIESIDPVDGDENARFNRQFQDIIRDGISS